MEIGGWVGADQSTGRIVHVPNSYVFQHPVYNYTRAASASSGTGWR
jgi:small-conductance mechanosensitive channel